LLLFTREQPINLSAGEGTPQAKKSATPAIQFRDMNWFQVMALGKIGDVLHAPAL